MMRESLSIYGLSASPGLEALNAKISGTEHLHLPFPVGALPVLLAVRLQLVAAIALPHQISASLHRFLGLMSAFHTHVVLLCFPDLFVELARNQMGEMCIRDRYKREPAERCRSQLLAGQ